MVSFRICWEGGLTDDVVFEDKASIFIFYIKDFFQQVKEGLCKINKTKHIIRK